jgi:uncharacterized protein YaaR (DUF327 family)
MALNQSYELYDLLYDKYGSQKPYYKMTRIEKEYLKNLSIKRDDKSLKRVADIKLRIRNDLNKNCFNKKYQIQSFDEYNMIKEWIKTIGTKGYELLWHSDQNGEIRNQLYKIIEGDYSCCKDCDRPMTFVSRKVPVKYCYFYKN